jgi:hypothetical protein
MAHRSPSVSSEARGYWQQLSFKLGVAVAVCLTMRAIFAQAPAAPAAASSFAAEVQKDERGYKFLVPLKSLTEGLQGKKKETEVRNMAKDVRTGTRPLQENVREFEAYYTRYLFPFMTQTNEASLKALADRRQSLFRDHIEGAKVREVHDLLVALTLAEMTKVVRDPEFHPAVRYNAMLIISDLNDVEPVRSISAPQFPVPCARALPVILAEFKRPENTDAIRLAALLGLSRHLEWENEKAPGVPTMPPAIKADIIKELQALVQAKTPPTGRNDDAHQWLRRRALEGLGFAATKTPNQETANLLVALLKDETEPLPLRAAAAALMGKISYQQPVTVDAVATAKDLGYFALVATDAELTRVTTRKKDEEEQLIRLQGQFPSDLMVGMMPQSIRAAPGTTGSPDGGSGMMPGGGGMMPGGGAMMPGGSGYSSSAYGGSADSGYGGMGTYIDPSLQDPKGYRYEQARRRIRHYLYCVQLGLTGGEDRPEVKTSGTQQPTKSGGSSRPDPTRGLWAAAKTPQERESIDRIYSAVRKLIVIVEKTLRDDGTLGTTLTGQPIRPLDKFDKDMRREMKNTEVAVGRKLVAPAAAGTASAGGPDLPGGPGGPPGKAGPGKTGKGAPVGTRPTGPGRPVSRPPAPGFRGSSGCF